MIGILFIAAVLSAAWRYCWQVRWAFWSTCADLTAIPARWAESLEVRRDALKKELERLENMKTINELLSDLRKGTQNIDPKRQYCFGAYKWSGQELIDTANEVLAMDPNITPSPEQARFIERLKQGHDHG